MSKPSAVPQMHVAAPRDAASPSREAGRRRQDAARRGDEDEDEGLAETAARDAAAGDLATTPVDATAAEAPAAALEGVAGGPAGEASPAGTSAATDAGVGSPMKLGLGVLALAGLAAAAGGGGGGSKAPSVPAGPSEERPKPEGPAPSKPGPVTDGGVVNGQGGVVVDGLKPGADWQFSTDGGQTWKPGTGNSIPAADLNEGHNTVIVSQTDGAGNTSTSMVEVVKDTVVAKPELGTSSGNGNGDGGNTINGSGSVTVGGIEPGANWEFSTDGGQTWKPGTGNSIPAADLNEGHNTVIVSQTDGAGNTSTSTVEVVKDTVVAKPELGTSSGNGSNTINGDGSVTVGGIEAGADWEFSTDGGQTWKPGTGNSIPAADLNEGHNTVIVSQTDGAGNTSTSTVEVVKDTVVAKPELGTSNGNGSNAINGSGSVTVGGIEAGADWEFSTDGGQTWKPGTGNSIPAADLNEGHNTVIVSQTDGAGNTSTSTVEVVKDTVVAKPELGTSSGDGNGDGGNTINGSGSVTVGGIEPGANWEFSTDGGQTWKPGTGNSIPAADLNEGHNTVIVSQTDGAGNTSTSTVEVVKDTVVAKPELGTSNGNGSNAINGSGSVTVGGIEAGADWEFSTDGGQTWKPGSGNTIPASDLNEGLNTIIVSQTDAAGNTSTSTVEVVKDTVVAKPELGTSSGDGNGDGGNTINGSGSVTVGGIEPGANWEFSTDGGQTWKPGTGNSIPAADLNEGPNTIIVSQTDGAGNTSTSTVEVVKDTIVAKPELGTSNGSSTNSGNGTINGDGSVTIGGLEQGGKWEFSTDGGQTWKPGSGNTIPASDLNEGPNTIVVSQTDGAGNTSTSTVEVVKDTTVAKPDLGTSNGGNTINGSGSVTVGGLEQGGKWEFSTDGGQTWKPGSGNTIPASDLNEGPNTIIVSQTDGAGNTSTSTVEVVKDTVVAKPELGTSSGNGNGDGDGGNTINGSGSVTVGGIEPGANWEFSTDGGQTWKPGTGNSIPAADLNEGPNTIIVSQTDGAGNTSTSTVEVVKDTVVAKPELGTSSGNGSNTINGNGSVTVGGIEHGANWEFSTDGGQTWKPGSGNTIPAADLNEGPNTIIVSQTDGAGNTSTSTVEVVKDTIVAKPDLGTSNGSNTINGSGSVTVGGLEQGGKWEFSTDGGQTWKPGSGNSIPASDLNEGANTIIVSQTDGAGNTSTSTVQVVKDTIVAKPDLGTSNGSNTINGSGSVTVGGLEQGGKWEFSTDGGQTWKPGSGNSIPASDLNEGANTIIVSQTDGAGNTSTSTVQVVKDTIVAKPELGTSNGSSTNSGNGTINGDGSVTIGGLEQGGKWEFSTDGGQTWKPGSGNTIPASDLNEGLNTIIVSQTDGAGNTSTSTVEVVKDTIVAKPDLGTSNGSNTINGSGSVTVGGLEQGGKWEFSTDGGQTWKPGSGNTIPASDLNEGSNTIIVSQTDVAGNTSASTLEVVKDTIAAKPDLGTSNGSNTINGSGSVTVGGIEPGADWEFSTDGGQTWKPGTGNSIPADALAEGSNAIAVVQTDAAGNRGEPAEINVVKDTIAAAPTLALTVDSGNGSDRLTNDGRISVTGIEAGATWEYSIDGGQWQAGSQSTIADPGFSDGAHTVQVRQTDALGNASQESSLSFTIDKSAPSTPNVSLRTDSGTAGDRVTNDAAFRLSGLETTANFRVLVDGWGLINGWGGGNTSGVFNLGGYVSDGAHTVRFQQVDAAGNASGWGETLSFTLDRTVAAPLLALANDTGTSATDGLTRDATINVAGLETGATWDYSLDNGATWLAGTGTALASDALKEGANTVQVRQTDLAGNRAVATIEVIKDTTVAKPDLGTSNGSGTINGSGSVTVGGLEQGGKWEFSTDGGQTWRPGSGNAIAASELNEGANTIIVSQTDGAGNTSRSDLVVIKDSFVAAPRLVLAQDSGIADDRLTISGHLLVGDLEANATWQYSIDGGHWITGDARAFIGDPGYTDGAHTVSVRQIDAAGNASPETSLTFTIDKTDPAAPVPSLANDTGTPGDGITSDRTIRFSGLEVGGTLTIVVNGESWSHPIASSTQSFVLDGSIPDGHIEVVAIHMDAAGNTAHNVLTFRLDSTVQAPELNLASDTGVSATDGLTRDATINVAGLETGAKWDYSLNNGATWLAGTGTALASDALKEGANTVQVRQTDLAGNQAVATIEVIKDTTVAKPDLGTSNSSATIDFKGFITVGGLESGGKWEFSSDGGQTWRTGTGNTIAGTNLAPGLNSITVKQTDAAGNVATSDPIAVTLDDPTPAVGLHAADDSDRSTYFVGDKKITVHVVRADLAVTSVSDLSALPASQHGEMSTSSTAQAYVDGLADGAYRFYVASASGLLSEVRYTNAGLTDSAAIRYVTGGKGSFVGMPISVGTAAGDTFSTYYGVLAGGKGADTFRTQGDHPALFLTDYNRAEGDVIDLTATLSGMTANNLSSYVSKQVGANGQITLVLDTKGSGDFQDVNDAFVTLLNRQVAQDIQLRLADGSTAVI